MRIKDIKIKQLNINDYERYINLIKQLRPIDIEISYDKFIEIYDTIFKSNVIFVAEYENKLIGSITLIIEQKFIHNLSKYVRIEDVIVDNNYKNKGIGTKLVSYAIQYSKNIGAFKITLTCKKDLIPFYSKNNFEVYDIHMSQLL